MPLTRTAATLDEELFAAWARRWLQRESGSRRRATCRESVAAGPRVV